MDLLDFAIRPLRDFLTDGTLKQMLERARRVSFDQGQPLHVRGDSSPRLCIIAEGAVRFGRVQPNGTLNLVSMIGVGGHFGEVAMLRSSHTHDAYAATDCEIDVLDSASLDHLLETTPDFAAALWRANTARLNALLELYDGARTLGVAERLAKVIYLHAGRGEIADGVACLQRDLAALLGVSQVSVGTALKTLEKAGLVHPGYRCVRVPDKPRLKTWLRNSGAV